MLFRLKFRQDVVDCLRAASTTNDVEARAYLEKVLDLEPSYEEALQELLKLLVKQGRRREAIKRYQKFEKILKTEMDIEPLAETKAILG